MAKLSSTDALEQLRERILTDNDRSHKPCLVICAGTACQASGANSVQRLLKRHLMERDLLDRVDLRVTGCHGFCEVGPFVLTEPQGAFYSKVGPKDIPKIINAVLAGEYVEDLLYRDPVSGERCYHVDDIPFFKNQRRMLLSRNQQIDPIRLFNYLGRGGYSSLAKVITQYDSEGLLDEVERAGLRGRGGAGFPTARKWRLARAQPKGGGKYIVCNADEGDPGAYMDRSILEGNPHSVIEGMVIGALAMGATEGFILVRHEYPLAIKHARIALRLAREYGLLGTNILGSGFDFDIHIVKSAGAFVCGEETALIRTIEGFMGEPRQRPPYPIERGIFGRPTCINNVETWANVPVIFDRGADEYAKIGTENSKGTKVFSLVGKIRNTGLVEVPMGISIREIVYDIGGGPTDGQRIKAVQIGGPSGGCIPSELFDLPIDYDGLREVGAIMGSGGMIVMDESTCMVDVAKYFMGFLKDESCGKCFTCRKGTQRMWEILDDITSGRGTMAQIGLLQELAETVRDASMCGLGQSAPNPVLSTLRYFKEEYVRHIEEKRCDALVCKELVGAPCQAACPLGTEVWRYAAHVARGEYDEAYRVIRKSNPLPSVCSRVCHHPCEHSCRLGTTGQEPVAARALKRFVTDRVRPDAHERPRRLAETGKRVAVIGAGPAGLAACEELYLAGHEVSLFDAAEDPGGMLLAGIPSYRLPREVLRHEVKTLLAGVQINGGVRLGSDITIDSLFEDGFDAVLLATGAHASRGLGLEGERASGVMPALEFLRDWNLNGAARVEGRVGIVGGGNSAVDAARVAIRQKGVESVTIFYRRSRAEMPAFAEEIEAALSEGVQLEPLVTPRRLRTEQGRLVALEVVENQLGEVMTDGRRRPVEIAGSERTVPLDTLLVAIGEQSSASSGDCGSIEIDRGGRLVVSRGSATNRVGVFAAGDVVSGPNTVVDALAAGKRSAREIDCYLLGKSMESSASSALPCVYVPPPVDSDEEEALERCCVPLLPLDSRVHSFAEIEMPLRASEAIAEARRCLRCDLEFVRVQPAPAKKSAAGEKL